MGKNGCRDHNIINQGKLTTGYSRDGLDPKGSQAVGRVGGSKWSCMSEVWARGSVSADDKGATKRERCACSGRCQSEDWAVMPASERRALLGVNVVPQGRGAFWFRRDDFQGRRGGWDQRCFWRVITACAGGGASEVLVDLTCRESKLWQATNMWVVLRVCRASGVGTGRHSFGRSLWRSSW